MGTEKRKRSQKTSHSQYERYLQFMEGDAILRSGTINPTINPNYIQEKWKKLTNVLNADGNGPVLTCDEWKKRFTDWKNTTRAKYRKLVEDKKRTGGGPCSTTSLTPLEERGLAVWGKVVVTGSVKVDVSGGLQCVSASDQQDAPEELVEPEDNEPTVPLLSPESEFKITKNENTTKNVFLKNSLKRKMQTEKKSLKSIGEELLNTFKNNNNEPKRLALDIAKFKFEVAKYKFENPDFNFDDPILNN